MMEIFIALILTSILSYNNGYDSGIEYQKYYDMMMREKVIDVVYQKGYDAGLKKTELDKQIKLINLGIEYMEDK